MQNKLQFVFKLKSKEIFVMRHNLGHSNFYALHVNLPDFHRLNVVFFYGFEKMIFSVWIHQFSIQIFCLFNSDEN